MSGWSHEVNCSGSLGQSPAPSPEEQRQPCWKSQALQYFYVNACWPRVKGGNRGDRGVLAFLLSPFVVGHRDSRLHGVSEVIGRTRVAWKMMGTVPHA